LHDHAVVSLDLRQSAVPGRCAKTDAAEPKRDLGVVEQARDLGVAQSLAGEQLARPPNSRWVSRAGASSPSSVEDRTRATISDSRSGRSSPKAG